MLADFEFDRRELNFKGGSFFLEGLSLESFAVLIRTHLKDLEGIFDLFKNHKGDLKDEDVQNLIVAAIEETPGFVANVIALAAREPTAAPQAIRLPFPIQVEALNIILELTFDEVGGIKKFMPSLVRLIGAENFPKLNQLKADS
jgi:hypothetical protein